MDQLRNFTIALLVLIVGVSVVVGLFAELNRRRLKGSPQLGEQVQLELQAELLEAIKAASANHREIIDIRPFWKSRKVQRRQRLAVITPLIENRDVDASEDVSENEYWDTFRAFWRYAFYLPPTKLTLTDKTWTQMNLKGISGTEIVIERVETLISQKAGRDITGSPVTKAGRDAKVHVDRAHSEGDDSFPIEKVTELVSALRSDAPLLMGDDAANVRELADKLERQANKKHPDEDTIVGGMQRAERYVKSAGGLMKATAKFFEAWQEWGGFG